MRVWESRSPPAYRTTSDEPVSSEVVSTLCVSLADFRRVLKSSQISQISQILVLADFGDFAEDVF